VNGHISEEKSLHIRCVQGPKLFNLCMRENIDKVNGQHLTTWADNTYVFAPMSTKEEQISEVQNTLSSHLNFLNEMGMFTNLSKTEEAIFSRAGDFERVKIIVAGKDLTVREGS